MGKEEERHSATKGGERGEITFRKRRGRGVRGKPSYSEEKRTFSLRGSDRGKKGCSEGKRPVFGGIKSGGREILP